jgi:hypothetical protein
MVHNAIVSGNAGGAGSIGIIFQSHNEQLPDNCPEAGRATKTAARASMFRTAFGNSMGDDEIAFSAYPNPFASTATIEFELTNATQVSVEVFDINGKKVADLFTGVVDAGNSYRVQLQGDKLQSGIYIYRITAGDHVYNDRLILIK